MLTLIYNLPCLNKSNIEWKKKQPIVESQAIKETQVLRLHFV